MKRWIGGALVVGTLVLAGGSQVAAQQQTDDHNQHRRTGDARNAPVPGGGSNLPSQAVEQDEVLGYVGETPITRNAVHRWLDILGPQAHAQFRTPDGRKSLLERYAQELVWLHEAEGAGVGEREEVLRQLEQNRRSLLIRTYLQEVMVGVPTPSESLITAYYEEHKEETRYQTPATVEVRHIQVAEESEGERVMSRLDRGEKFEDLVERLSIDGATKESGGYLGRIQRGGVFGTLGRQVALAESAFVAPVGVPVGPYRSSVGWHVLLVDESIPATAMPLESVRPQLVSTLSRDLQEQFYQSRLADAEASAGLRWNDAAVDTFLYGRKTAGELFREAQTTPTADGRIDNYRLVVDNYPDSEFAPQSLFMIGFIYSEQKNDYDKAEAAFRELQSKYPNSELVDSAQWMLENMRTGEVPDFNPLEGGTLPVVDDNSGDS